jgi:hypothetical protein
MPESIREVLGLGKVPPQNTEAEMAVLGSMLIEKEAALKAFDMLREGDFYSPTHQIVFEAIRTLHDQNVAADIVTVGDYLQHNHYLNVFAKPVLGVALAGSEYGPVGDATVAGRAAKVFERTRNEFVPARNFIDVDEKEERREPRVYDRREMMARPVAVRERFVVIPAESGFFALRYSARQADFNAFLPEFEKVLASFAPRH